MASWIALTMVIALTGAVLIWALHRGGRSLASLDEDWEDLHEQHLRRQLRERYGDQARRPLSTHAVRWPEDSRR